jgi:regulator of sirC expression with transglutaminase-like and TPR domain
MALSEQMPESRRLALLKLLSDEDPAVFDIVRQQIISYGPQARNWLRPHALSSDPPLRRRVQQILTHFDRQSADTKFLGFCMRYGQDLDLEQGVFLLAQTQYPDINVEAYQAILDSYAMDLRERLNLSGEPKEIIAGINTFLFKQLKFTGNEKHYYDPENSYLNRVLDRRIGNPINLCVVYLLLARRLRLPMAGIGLPGHFICRYQSSGGGEIYVDPFNGGKCLSKAECVQYLAHATFSLRDDYLSPVNPRRTLLRICTNLHQIYLQLEQADATTRFQRYLVALGR